MTPMSSRIRETLDGLASKAEHYAQATNDPRALVQQVIQLGMAAIGSSKLSPADGEQIAAMMIAALTLARPEKKPSEES